MPETDRAELWVLAEPWAPEEPQVRAGRRQQVVPAEPRGPEGRAPQAARPPAPPQQRDHQAELYEQAQSHLESGRLLQAIGEGIDLLENFPDDLPITDVVGCWRNGSVIRSWLVDLMHEALQKEPKIDDVPGYIEDTGEVNWLVSDAMEMEVPIPVISQSVIQLFASRDDRRAWARAIAMMRHGFGGHPYGPDDAVGKDRKSSRLR